MRKKIKDITPKYPLISAREKIQPPRLDYSLGEVVGGIKLGADDSTVNGRSLQTIASAVDVDGNIIRELINSALDTQSKTILGNFTFGVSGAIQIGTYEAGVSGDVKISPSGIVGRNKSNATTFALNAETGEITAIKLVGASGEIGGWTIGATDLRATSGGNTTILSSGATAFSAGPTGSPAATITQAGVLSAAGAIIDGTSTIGGRIASVLASAIDASGHFIDAALDTSAKKILQGFSLDTENYAGAVKAGDITWDAATGAITGGSGVVLHKGGIIQAENGVVKATLPISGSPTFAGTLTAASGTFGTITAGIIDGCDVFANNFRFKKNTNLLLLGNQGEGWTKSISGGGALSVYGANQMAISLASASDETSYTQCDGFSIVIGTAIEQAVQWNYNPSLEFWAKPSIATTDPTVVVRMGAVNVDNTSSVGWKFSFDGSAHKVATQWYDGSEHNGDAGGTGFVIDRWHRYKIEVTKTSANNYTIVWKIDDTVFETQYVTSEWATTGTMFGVKVKNNAYDINATVSLIIAQAIFQQNY